MVGERTGTGYRLGDPVTVKIVEVLPLAGSMRFEMLSEPRKLGTATKSFHKARKGQGRNARKTGAGARPAESRTQTMSDMTFFDLWRRRTGAETIRSCGDEARFSRPLPALRRRQAVQWLRQAGRYLLRYAAKI
jgi:hypothetical protein